MKMISEYIGQRIWFKQPSMFKRFHELKAGEELIGALQQKGFFCMRWEVTIRDKNWEIYRPSCWRTVVEIRDAGYEMPFANFQKDRFRSKGALMLPKGERLKIAPHFLKGFCEITNEQGESIVRIKLKTALGDKAEVLFEKSSETIDKYPWILMLAYIIALEQKHQAAHSGI